MSIGARCSALFHLLANRIREGNHVGIVGVFENAREKSCSGETNC